MDLGTIGVWTRYRDLGEENAAEAARLVKELGYGAVWLGGSPRLPTLPPLLEATANLVVATGTGTAWAYDPAYPPARPEQLREPPAQIRLQRTGHRRRRVGPSDRRRDPPRQRGRDRDDCPCASGCRRQPCHSPGGRRTRNPTPGMDRSRRSHDCRLSPDLEGELAGVFCGIDRAFGLGV